MGKGGGGYDTSGMEAAARESNALQKQMYEEALKRGEPFYQGGLSAYGTILDYMGLPGGSVKTRDQLAAQLTPQYTKTTAAPSGYSGTVYKGVFNPSALAESDRKLIETYRPELLDTAAFQAKNKYGYQYGVDQTNAINKFLQGAQPMGAQTTTDTAGLNAAIDAQMASQGTPEYYGSLMKNFGLDTFQADPSYQFRLSEGNKAIDRAMAARGKTFSPESVMALTRYGQDAASQEYQNAYNRYNMDQTNIYNRLAGLAGMGQQESAGMNQAGQLYAGNVGATNASLAQSQIAAAQAQSAAKGSMWGGLLGLGGKILAAPTTGGGSVFGSIFLQVSNGGYIRP